MPEATTVWAPRGTGGSCWRFWPGNRWCEGRGAGTGGCLHWPLLPAAAGHTSWSEEQVERRGCRAGSSWTLARIPQKGLSQDVSPWAQLREPSPRPLAWDACPVSCCLYREVQTLSRMSRALPSCFYPASFPRTSPTAAPHYFLHSLHLPAPPQPGWEALLSFSVLKTLSPSSIAVPPCLQRSSNLCPVPPQPPLWLFTCTSEPSLYRACPSPRMQTPGEQGPCLIDPYLLLQACAAWGRCSATKKGDRGLPLCGPEHGCRDWPVHSIKNSALTLISIC